MTAVRTRPWIGVDIGKTHHWVCAVDETGERLLSLKVLNDEAEILDVITAVSEAAADRVWAIDILGTPSALLVALLAKAGEQVRCASGRVVAAMSTAYTGEGHRRQGVTAPLLEGAVAYAASHGAPAVEAHPVDPPGRMDLTMAFVGTKSMFERAGFRVVGSTGAVASGRPRLIMRRDLPAQPLTGRQPP